MNTDHRSSPEFSVLVQCFKCHASFKADGHLCVTTIAQPTDWYSELKKDLARLRSLFSNLTTVTCPKCGEKRGCGSAEGSIIKIGGANLGCPFCLKNFNIDDDAFGQHIYCPYCFSDLALCQQNVYRRNFHNAAFRSLDSSGQRWKVLSSNGSLVMQVAKRQDLIDAIIEGKVRGDNLCVKYEFAPTDSLKALCDGEYGLRRLYDPAGTLAIIIGFVVGFCFAVTVGNIVAALLHVSNGIEALVMDAVVGSAFGLLAYWISWRVLKKIGFPKPKVRGFT